MDIVTSATRLRTHSLWEVSPFSRVTEASGGAVTPAQDFRLQCHILSKHDAWLMRSADDRLGTRYRTGCFIWIILYLHDPLSLYGVGISRSERLNIRRKATQHSTPIFLDSFLYSLFPRVCSMGVLEVMGGRGGCWWTKILGNIEFNRYIYIRISQNLTNLFCDPLMVETGMTQQNFSTAPIYHKTLH